MSSTDSKAPPDSARQELLDDHRQVRGLLADLDRYARGSVADREKLLPTLRELQGKLEHHFKAEESLHRGLVEDVPRLARALGRLYDDHTGIVDDLVMTLSAEGDDLTSRCQKLVERIQEHEAAENEVMQGAYWDDIGGGG